MEKDQHHPALKRDASSPLAKAATSGIVWTMALSLCGRGASLVSQLILARLLAPEDFGILGLAYSITALFSILASVGVEQVLQQRQPRMHVWATQAFVISLGLTTLVAAAIAVYAPIGARLYHDGRITSLVWVIAASMPFSALSTVPQARLKAMLRFKFLAIYGSSEQLAIQCLTVLLAWSGMGAISFVLPIPLMAIIRACIFWRIAPIPLRPLRLSRGWGRMMSRGANVFGITVLNTSIGQADYVTLGLLASAHVVGIYFFALRIVIQPMAMLASNFTSVLRPTLIAMNGDPDRQCRAALKTAELLTLLTVLVCYLQAAVAEPGLKLLFGTRWVEAIPLIQILSFGLPLDPASWAAGSLLESRGQFAKSFRYQLMTAPIFFILVGAGALLGSSVGVAIGVTIYYTIHPIFLTTLVFSKEGVSIRRVLSCFYIPVLLGGTTIGGAYALSRLPLFDDRPVLQILVVVLLGGFAYLLAVKRWVPHIYDDIHTRLFKALRIKRQLMDSTSKI
jgi:O-antigen/teichoic acid export membrane protein